MYYTEILRLCGWEESQIRQERPRLDEAFRILELGPEEMKHAEARVREDYDIELTGVRKALGVWIAGLIDIVLARKERKKIIYYNFPTIGGLGFTTSVLGGEGTLCVCPEFVLDVALGGIFDKIAPILEAAEGRVLPRSQAQCGLNKLRVGAITKGIIPVNDLSLTSSFFCDQGPKTDEWLHEVYDIPWVVVDSVMDSDWNEFPDIRPERISYLGTEINQAFERLMKEIGRTANEADWTVYNEQYSKFATAMSKINQFMKNDPVPIGQGNVQLLRFCRNGIGYGQFPQLLEAMDIMIPELAKRVEEGKGPFPKGAPRVFGLLFTLSDQALVRLIERAGISIPVTAFSYEASLGQTQSNYTTLGEKRAEVELKRGMYHSTSGYLYWLKKGCQDWNVDGVIWTWALHCRPSVLTGFIYKKVIEEELRTPTLSLEIDWWDSRTYNAETLSTRIETFAQLLAAKKVEEVKVARRRGQVMFVCGMDVGAATTEAVILSNSQMVSYSILPTGHSVSLTIDNVVKEAVEKGKLTIAKFDFVVSTGYGRHSVTFANKAITEIICHARGAKFLIPSARTVIDIGGQDSKVIILDEDGNVTNFVMNDKCAAGTGRFIEVMSNVLEVSLEDMGKVSLTSQKPRPISSTCTVFAESEVVSLRAEGEPRENLIAGIHKAIASRVAIMGRSIGFKKDLVFTGGVSKNVAVKRFLEDIIELEITVPEEPQIVGALGAALIAKAELNAMQQLE